jgi:phage tail-like protein
MASYYPPPGFHFKVEVQGLANDSDVRFTEVGGLSVEVSTEEVAEGGENRFTQKFPTRAKYPELVLKRGVLVESEITKWIRGCVEQFTIEPNAIKPKDIFIKLLNAEHQPLLTWHVIGAYPTKWAVNDLNSSANTVAVETLQLFYQRFNVLG